MVKSSKKTPVQSLLRNPSKNRHLSLQIHPKVQYINFLIKIADFIEENENEGTQKEDSEKEFVLKEVPDQEEEALGKK